MTRWETLRIMPRTAGVSMRTLERCGPRSPRPSRVLFCAVDRPIPDLTCVTLSLTALLASHLAGRANPLEGRNVLAAGLRHLLDRAQRLERGDRRVDDVVLVRRADRLGEDVGDPRDLEHRTNSAAGDDAGTGGRRAEQHPRCAEEGLDL